ncbi:hypothetical protein [Pelovirga terrestris]|nr:hypothetical protein [Pelovirga terrestris]
MTLKDYPGNGIDESRPIIQRQHQHQGRGVARTVASSPIPER